MRRWGLAVWLLSLELTLVGCPTGKSVLRKDASDDQLRYDLGDFSAAPIDSTRDARASDASDGAWRFDGAKPDGFDGGAATSIVLVALNNAVNGNLGGVAGADQLCSQAATAAGAAGSYRAFISSSTQSVRTIIAAAQRSLPVLDTRGVTLYPSWNAIFNTNEWRNGGWIYTFSGTRIDDGSLWPDSNAWNGTRKDGNVDAAHTCQDWTTASSSVRGAAGELDLRQLLDQDHIDCDVALALVCVRMP